MERCLHGVFPMMMLMVGRDHRDRALVQDISALMKGPQGAACLVLPSRENTERLCHL